MKIKAVIFDLGGVLIDWNPNYLFERILTDGEKRKYFFENICTSDWNEEQDAGRPIKEATEQLVAQHPEWEDYIRAYYDRWEEMLAGPISGTVEILKQLKQRSGLKLYALTNWSGETFPKALELYDFLHWFDGRVVSGDEKMRKPFARFYHTLLDRYQLKAEETLFIDDNLRNIKAAAELGMATIHYESSEQLRRELENGDLL